MGTKETRGEQQYLEFDPLLLYNIRIEHLHPDVGHFHLGNIEHDPEQRSSHLHYRTNAKKTSDDHGSGVEVQREYNFNARIPLVQIRFVGLVSFRFDRVLLPTFLLHDGLVTPGVTYLLATKKTLRRATQCTVNDCRLEW